MKSARIMVLMSLLSTPLGWGGLAARAELPAPPAQMAEWKLPWGEDVPGAMSAAALLDKPAGRDGPVTVRDGHFYAGSKRLRLWGASIVFGAAFPPHEQADRIAERLGGFGINCIRFHHMDLQPFPVGIFADNRLETLSPQAMDRLDYFVAALKKQGVYSDLNLHVSRSWSHAHHWPEADKLPGYDKQVDIFHPDLIAANKQYARDLLTHVNAYTKARYADEPAVAILEVNNEDTIFLWGGEQNLAKLPEPYAKILQEQWNRWLAKKHGSAEKLKAAWAAGVEPLGANLLQNALLSGVNDPQSKWEVENHDPAKMTAVGAGAPDAPAAYLHIAKVDGTDWHLQFKQSGLRLKKGTFYTLKFHAGADKPRAMGLSIGQAHEPWGNLGLATSCRLGEGKDEFRFGFVATADDDNARLSFSVGSSDETVWLRTPFLGEGGREGLRDGEDPARGTVARGGLGGAETPARSRDWYEFLQQTDESYFTDMLRFLKQEVGVKCPVTGTIGLGPLGTLSQSKMDFVDAHAYWDHPNFPRRQWDMKDWLMHNKPMVDDPAGATLWGLAATRVAGKPFTVTEYNHPAPNEWQAECAPLIAAYAAAQDWDAVFLFDYTDKSKVEQPAMTDFFSLEGNPLKMATLPQAARLFLGPGARPLAASHTIHPIHEQMLDNAPHYFYELWPFMRDVEKLTWQDALKNRLYLDFNPMPPGGPETPAADDPLSWTSRGPGSGTGQLKLADAGAAVFVGFAAGGLPADLGAAVTIEKLDTPFATLMLLPAEPGQKIADARHLLLTAVARGANTGMQWDAQRRTISDHWGTAPPLIEVVAATIQVAGDKPLTCYALTPQGKRAAKLPSEFAGGKTTVRIGSEPTLWYELIRE